jgi:hypothetical protein
MSRLTLITMLGCTGNLAGPELEEPPAPTIPQDVIPEEGTPTVGAYLSGTFSTLPAFQGVASVYGSVLLVRQLDGTASLSIAAAGLTPSVEHTAHVHAMPCDYGEGGGHYYIDPATPEIGEANEIWPRLTPGPEGYATTGLTLPAPPRGDALSVVIHDPETAEKLACADLKPEQAFGAAAAGTFSPFAYYEAIDETITGSASLLMSSSSTLTVELSGLTDTESYLAHLHVMPCELLDGGGHYKLDPSIVDTLEYNEVWPEIVSTGGGANATFSVTGHTIREDGASVVIHRVAGEEVPKVACANLAREEYLPLSTVGQFAPVPAAVSTLMGQATLQRRMDGATLLTVELTGGAPGAAYASHLHALPCSVLDGGGHYKIDPAVVDPIEENELWLDLRADATGAAKRTVGFAHLARAEAQSVVVHDEASNKLVCADLE